MGDKIAAEQLFSQRELAWRYTAMHFENGAKVPFPEPISYPGDGNSTEDAGGQTPQTLDELISPEVRKLLRGA